MSAKQRADGEALRAKYARVFGVPVETVKLELLEGEDVLVSHAFLCGPDWPVWSLGWCPAPCASKAGGKP